MLDVGQISCRGRRGVGDVFGRWGLHAMESNLCVKVSQCSIEHTQVKSSQVNSKSLELRCLTLVNRLLQTKAQEECRRNRMS